MAKKKTHKIKDTIINILIAWIVGFFLFTFIIGGAAMNGYISAGHYFVGVRGDEVKEVSKTIWYISYIWSTGYFVLFIPGLICIKCIEVIKRKHK